MRNTAPLIEREVFVWVLEDGLWGSFERFDLFIVSILTT
jgi:hypothetical protein